MNSMNEQLLTRIKSAAVWESIEKPHWLCDDCFNKIIQGIEYSVIDCRSQGKCSECGKILLTNTKSGGGVDVEVKKNRYDIAIERVAEESPSIKTLLDLQIAYDRAVERMHRDGDHADCMVYAAVEGAIRDHCVMMAERSGEQEFAETLRQIEGVNWGKVVYMMAEKLPRVDRLIEKHMG